MKKGPFPQGLAPAGQRGAVLVVSLLILLTLTVLGIGGLDTSGTQAKIVSNQVDSVRALQAADAATQDGRDWVAGLGANKPEPGGREGTECTKDPGDDTRCQVYLIEKVAGLDSPTWWTQVDRDPSWWESHAFAFTVGDRDSGTPLFDPVLGEGESPSAEDLHLEPHYVVEEMDKDFLRNNLSAEAAAKLDGIVYYRVTTYAEGTSENTRAMVQATYSTTF